MRRSVLLVLACFALLCLAVALGLAPRLTRQKALLAASKEERERLPLVNVIAVRHAAPTAELVLPGNVEPILEAPIYARADGYLRKLRVDIGDRVKAGQVLGEIESPEIDQQIHQAEAA